MPLTNSDFNAIMRIYSDRQLEDKRALEDRQADAYRCFPRLREIAQEIASLSVRKARARLGVEGAEDFDYPAALSELEEERESLLSMGGYPKDYLSMQYHCPICRDTGFVHGEKCVCFRREELAYLYSGSNDREILELENFDHFREDYYSDLRIGDEPSPRENARMARASAEQFVARFGREFSNLFIYGEAGTGKTFLSHCIARELIKDGRNVLYLTATGLFDTMAKERFSHSDTSEAHTDQILSADLLIIDDLGTELLNSFVSSQLFYCVNERSLRKKPTVISSNLGLQELQERYSERTSSRIFSSYQLIRLSGDDIRIHKQPQGGK